MKTMTAPEFARKYAQAIAGLKPHQTLAVTKHGKTLFLVTKPGARKPRYVRAADMLKELDKLPMTKADGNEILRAFNGETVF